MKNRQFVSKKSFIAVLFGISMSVLATTAYAYKSQADCESSEGAGKCCKLGPQAGGGDHWGKCSYNAVMNKPKVDKAQPGTTGTTGSPGTGSTGLPGAPISTSRSNIKHSDPCPGKESC